MNNLLTTSWLTMESARHLLNEMCITKGFDQSYQKDFKLEFAVGQQIQARYPQRFIAQRSLAWNPQNLDNRTFPVNCDQVASVQCSFDSIEAALKLPHGDDYASEHIIKPAMNELAQVIESSAAEFAYLQTPNCIGAVGTTPTTMAPYGSARAIMVEGAAPQDEEWRMVVTPTMGATIQQAVSTIFNPAPVISEAFEKGRLGRGSGFKWYESMSLYRHTIGTGVTSPTCSVASANGDTTMVLGGTTGQTILAGDIFTIASCNAVNPQTRRSTGRLKMFKVLVGGTFASSLLTVTLTKPIYGPGDQYQTVDALPAAGAVLTLWPGTTSPSGLSGPLGLAFQKQAFTMVGASLPVPTAVEFGKKSKIPGTNLEVRATKTWDNDTGSFKFRFDTAWGFGAMYPESCAVLIGSAN